MSLSLLPTPPVPCFFNIKKVSGNQKRLGFFLTQQNRRVIYFAMNNVVVQKIHFACWFVASMCVYTLGNLNVEPALWLQCSVIERLNHTASGSLLKLFLPYCPPLTCSGERVHRHTGLGFLFMTQRAFCWEVEAEARCHLSQ